MEDRKLNRIKIALVEQGKTAKWLAGQLGKDPAVISKWCTNTTQPSLEILLRIAEILQVSISELVRQPNFERKDLRCLQKIQEYENRIKGKTLCVSE